MERLKRKSGHHSLRRDNKAVVHSLVHMELAQKALFPDRFQCRATGFRWTLGSPKEAPGTETGHLQLGGCAERYCLDRRGAR